MIVQKEAKDSILLALTRKTDYALVAMVALAESAPGSRSARDLSDSLLLPAAALRNILKDLARAGLLESTQGSAGGYRLPVPADRVTLASIVRAIEGPVRLVPCCTPGVPADAEACRREDSCRIKSVVRTLNDRLAGFLAEVTLADLLAETSTPGADRASAAEVYSDTPAESHHKNPANRAHAVRLELTRSAST